MNNLIQGCLFIFVLLFLFKDSIMDFFQQISAIRIKHIKQKQRLKLKTMREEEEIRQILLDQSFKNIENIQKPKILKRKGTINK